MIKPGELQRMTAGTHHALEFNHSSENGVHFLQIWIMPAQQVGARIRAARFLGKARQQPASGRIRQWPRQIDTRPSGRRPLRRPPHCGRAPRIRVESRPPGLDAGRARRDRVEWAAAEEARRRSRNRQHSRNWRWKLSRTPSCCCSTWRLLHDRQSIRLEATRSGPPPPHRHGALRLGSGAQGLCLRRASY